MSAEHWSTYYRGGALVSCPTNAGPGYAGRVRTAWEDFFAGLPRAAAVLDLGTGNGPVLLIAKSVSDANALGLKLVGVDLAEIDPVTDVADGERLFEGIEFRPGVSTEALPFEDGSFEAASGQFIVEYTETAATLAELARVLAGGGRTQLILHHADSLIVANARESLSQLDLVRAERILDNAERYFEKAAGPAAAAEAPRQRLIASGKTLETAAEASASPLLLDYVLRGITTLLEHRRQLTRGDLLRQLKRLERELGLWERRLRDLVGAALDDSAIEALAGQARDAGFGDVRYAPQEQDGDVLIGWRLTATKTAA